MATSGSKRWEIDYSMSWLGMYWYTQFQWERVSYSIQDNTSTISWKYQWGTSEYAHESARTRYNITIDDKTYSEEVSFYINPTDLVTIAQGTTVISHNSDGTKTFSVSIYDEEAGINSSLNVSLSFTLDTLPRPPKINSATNFTDEGNPTMLYTNYVKDVEVEACISFTGENDDIPYRVISSGSGVGTPVQYRFEFTDEERAILWTKISEGPSITVRFYVRSMLEGVYYENYSTATLTFVNYMPLLNPTVTDVNARTVELTGNNQNFIRYYSNAEFNTGAETRKGSYIENQYVKCGDVIMGNMQEGVIESVTSNTYYFSVTDSNGHTTRDAVVRSVDSGEFIEYVKLTSSLTTEEMTANGNLTFTISGKYFNGSFGAKTNTMEIEYGLRENNDDIVWTKLGYVNPTVNGSDYTYSYTITGLNHDSKYDLTVNVIDELSPVQTATKVLAAVPVFDWGKNDFKHYTNVYLDNNKTLRSYQANGADVQILGLNSSNGTVLGWGGYDRSNGDTGVYGNNVRIHTKEKFLINGREYGQNKVLWESTGWYMNGSQAANLSEAISAQPNGIVLVFSLYDPTTNTSSDVSINTFFVSKKEVELLPNAPHTFFMMINSGFSVIGAKYLYIDDTTITGHDTNSTSGSNNNFAFNNNRFVLRYVIGV